MRKRLAEKSRWEQAAKVKERAERKRREDERKREDLTRQQHDEELNDTFRKHRSVTEVSWSPVGTPLGQRKFGHARSQLGEPGIFADENSSPRTRSMPTRRPDHGREESHGVFTVDGREIEEGFSAPPPIRGSAKAPADARRR